MRIVRDVETLRNAVAALRADGPVALVPTMGALHAGHLSLLAEGRRRAANVVASIFVNPRQFGPAEDLSRYPRREAADAHLLRAAGCALLFAPPPEAVYPPGFATNISVSGLDRPLEGASRPGHFDGVATVVAKLLIMVAPDVAVFGEKDWQQLAVIRRLAADLDLPVAIVGAPTVREADGLALSSRNAYLSAPERAAASALPAMLRTTAAAIAAGRPITDALADGRRALTEAGFVVDYLECCDETMLHGLDRAAPGARLFAAARIGTTRLIDNWKVEARCAPM